MPCGCQYEEAVKWIENEIHTNGVFKVEQATAEIYDHKTQITRMMPTGRLRGFTVSSQHTPGRDFNILQLITTMKLQAEKERKITP